MTHVLIVDDNLENLYLLRALLQGNGYTVDEARHGTEALAKALQNPPDLTISDLLMPVMDGYTFLRHWKADERLKVIPFIVYTATYTDPKDERLALDLGADAFIVKPSEPEPFMAAINDVLAKQHRGELPPASERRFEDDILLKEYNEVLIHKLEKKSLQLEQTNRELLEEIAERKQTEEALRLRDRAIQAVSQGILITDPTQPDNPITYVSAGFERMTGYRSQEALGRNCRFLQGRDTDQETVGQLRQAIAAGHACVVEILNYRKDGTPFWNALSLNPVHNEKGALVYFVGVQNDVTERKQLEEQLRHSQKLEAVGQLAGSVAHDFNNLLTAINGYCDWILRRWQLDDPTRPHIQAIRTAGQSAVRLTRQLLLFSRRQVLQPKIICLNSIIVELEPILKRLTGEEIEFRTTLDPDLGEVKVDPGHIEQVIVNLVVNARDAMPQGGKLVVETKNVVLDEGFKRKHFSISTGSYVRLTVSDTGIGMNEETQRRIFEPFFTTKEEGKGTGFGLSTVYGIVKQSGGDIWVSSKVGTGTSFKILLPRVEREVPELQPKVEPEPLVRGQETILIAEDEPLVRSLIQEVLTDFGYRVLLATNGTEALSICRNHPEPIQLLITDLMMPEVKRRELVEEVLAVQPDIRVLYILEYSVELVVHYGLHESTAPFLQKPFTPNWLLRKVRQVLEAPVPGKTTDRPASVFKILLIDDNDQLRALLKLLLTESGYEVWDLPNGKKADEMVKQHHHDLVITDLIMPDSEGLEVIRKLKHTDTQVPIIAMSGGGKGDATLYLNLAHKLGAQYLLSKPFTNEEFLTTVRLALESK